MKTVTIVSGRGCLQDREACSSFETGAHLVSVISKGPVIVLCVHAQICILFFNANFKLPYFQFGLSLYVRSFNIA